MTTGTWSEGTFERDWTLSTCSSKPTTSIKSTSCPSAITFILVLVRSGMKGSACPEQLHSWGIVRGHRGTYHGIKRGESPGKVDDRHFSCCLHLAVYQVVGRKKTVGGKCIQGNQTQSALESVAVQKSNANRYSSSQDASPRRHVMLRHHPTNSRRNRL